MLVCCIEHFYRNWQKLGIYVQKAFFSSYWAIYSYTFLLFWSMFTEIDQKIVIMSKKCFSHQNEKNEAKRNLFVVLKYFLQKFIKNLPFRTKKYFSQQIEPLYCNTKFFCCFEAFFQKLTKNLSFRSKYCFSQLIETYTSFFLFKIRTNPSLFVVLNHFYRN